MTIVHSILLLCIIGVIAGFALYFVAKKFKTDENPLYGEVESMCLEQTAVVVDSLAARNLHKCLSIPHRSKV